MNIMLDKFKNVRFIDWGSCSSRYDDTQLQMNSLGFI